MRVVVGLLAILAIVIVVGMTVAPTQPTVRDWYLSTACPLLDQISRDICAPIRRAAGEGTL